MVTDDIEALAARLRALPELEQRAALMLFARQLDRLDLGRSTYGDLTGDRLHRIDWDQAQSEELTDGNWYMVFAAIARGASK